MHLKDNIKIDWISLQNEKWSPLEYKSRNNGQLKSMSREKEGNIQTGGHDRQRG